MTKAFGRLTKHLFLRPPPPSSRLSGTDVPFSEPGNSSPFADRPVSEEVLDAVLWAMKFHRHMHIGHTDEVRVAMSDKDEAVYFVDDGDERCMVGRVVGSSPDGSTYCLVANADIGIYWRFRDGDDPLSEAFSDTHPLFPCAVYDGGGGPSNVADVQRFSRITDVPKEYLPPHPFIEFDEVL